MIFQLGCGHGLPGIFACLEGAAAIHFQDFNAEVLQYLTIPNVNSNVPSFQRPALQVTKCDAGKFIFLLVTGVKSISFFPTHKTLMLVQGKV
ncbi:histidine protein methyltransferase 1 homolog [Prunus yedoensis var. nudiflora]|uniref:Histidine protein methyltransferase 1 homolog n=1 Tax=Prunus yedoensis var. nudiflora TaxID=2094558 RepID=A0A314YE65_PRUYE|nr:histidine protein methyltransferase 1 homolog [Prunus yedoensis var. nudiflora]